VADLTLDQVLPIQNLAKRKAYAFVRRYNIPVDENEDVASQLVMAFIERWPKYDTERASVQTFASRIMDKELMSLLRYRLAQCRQVRELPVPNTGPNTESIHQFRMDLDRVMATMPEALSTTVFALSQYSTVDAADVVGCSRQTINTRKHQIRNAFVAAGITPSYFAGNRKIATAYDYTDLPGQYHPATSQLS